MRKLLITIFFLISIVGNATTYYLSKTGSDLSGNGSIGSPWLTLAYACTHATTSGDKIYVNAGTYTETKECVLSVGVSIEGAGKSNSIIKSHFVTSRNSLHPSHASITLSSPTQGTNGNQSISNLTLDGDNLTGDENGDVSYIGILVYQRSNVIIHDCIIKNFFTGGILLHGCYAYTLPSSYATGNQIYNCSIINCVDKAETYGSAGLIELGGQTELLIHDNTLNQTGRAKGHNGDIIVGVYNNKGVKIYNNKFYKPDDNGMGFNFHIEIWDVRGGWEVYNNEFYGGDTAIDIAGNFNYKGTYAYSWYIHHNYFTNNGGPMNRTNQGKSCIILEDDYIEDVIIEKNHFYKITRCLDIGNYGQSNQTKPIPYNRINITYNKFELCGWNASNEWDCIMRFRIKSDSYIQNVNIYNNIMLGDNLSQMTAIKLLPAGTFTNFNIKNNIVRYCNGDVYHNQYVHYGWLGVGNNGTINGLYVNNNILYNNYNNNNPALLGNAISNYTFLNNIKLDPLFVSGSDFHLQSSASPAINTGVNVDQLLDFDGVPTGNPPEIGIYEYTGENHPPSIIDQSFEIEENSPDGTVAGTVVASDPDMDQTLNYSILSGNISGTFVINDSTGVLSVANSAAINTDYALVVKVQDNGTCYLSSQATITINIIPTGIEITRNNSLIIVYPNPVSDELIIEIEGNNDRPDFEILNSIGNIVSKGNLSERTIVTTTSFSPGVYIIKIENSNSFKFIKIIKL